jgi:hypothetical protein
MRGGPARTICAAQVEGAPVWGPDGTILFTQAREGIFRVAAGQPHAVLARLVRSQWHGVRVELAGRESRFSSDFAGWAASRCHIADRRMSTLRP